MYGNTAFFVREMRLFPDKSPFLPVMSGNPPFFQTNPTFSLFCPEIRHFYWQNAFPRFCLKNDGTLQGGGRMTEMCLVNLVCSLVVGWFWDWVATDVWSKYLGNFEGLEACQRMCRAGSCQWMCRAESCQWVCWECVSDNFFGMRSCKWLCFKEL